MGRCASPPPLAPCMPKRESPGLPAVVALSSAGGCGSCGREALDARGRRVIGPDLTADQVIVVGDTPLDIACAKAVGAQSLAVATGGASHEQLAAHQPTWLCHDLREIAVDRIGQ